METNVNKNAIREAVLSYCEARNISRKELAVKTGVSSATLSHIINEKWESIDEKLWRKVESVVSSSQLDNTLPTRDLETVYAVCRNAQQLKQMAGLLADTGIGKTTAVTAFSARPNVYYYYIDATITPRVFLKDLLKEIGVQFEGSLNDMLQKLCSEINTMESPLLILDECAKLSERMLLIIHSIRDRTMKSCGMVLAGMPDFKTRLVKFAGKGKTGYGEFLRRVNHWTTLEGLTTGEINGILKHYGIVEAAHQKEFRHIKRFGDLKNEIDLYLSDKND